MGSWLWVKKNPRQFFSRRGIFNPLIEHRQQRVLRRHLALLDFAMRAAYSHRRWIPQDSAREVGRQLHRLVRPIFDSDLGYPPPKSLILGQKRGISLVSR